MFDVTPLVPEARPPVREAARVYVAHTRPWFIGLLVYGSAFKGGVIPGCSDIDLQLYLKKAAFAPDGQLPLEMSMAIHRDLARINPAPFQYIQCYALSEDPLTVGKDWLGPIPGSYHMLVGHLPVPEATEVQVRERATRLLATVQPDPNRAASKLLQHGGGRFENSVRFLCSDVWAALYSVLVVVGNEPLMTWALPKDVAVEELLKTEYALGRAVQDFHGCILRYYTGSQTLEDGLEAIKTGTAFLRQVQERFAPA